MLEVRATRRIPRPFRRNALVAVQTAHMDGSYFQAEGIHRVTTVVGGPGCIDARLLAEIESRSRFSNLIAGIMDSRLSAMVRDFTGCKDESQDRRAGAGRRYRITESTTRQSLGTGTLHVKEIVLTTREEASEETPYQCIRIGVAGGYMGFVTPTMFDAFRGLFSGEQVQVTLYAQGAYDVQKVTALFDRRTGKIVPGTITEHALHSKVPLPF